MKDSTINAAYVRVTLNTASYTPTVAVSSTGFVDQGLYGDASGSWTIDNFGRIDETQPGGSLTDREPVSAIWLQSANAVLNNYNTICGVPVLGHRRAAQCRRQREQPGENQRRPQSLLRCRGHRRRRNRHQ
jgi:hypothetical protein